MSNLEPPENVSCIDFTLDSKYIGIFSTRQIIFQENTNQKDQKDNRFKENPFDGEKLKTQVCIRFDCFSNLWLMDTEGTVSFWNSPLNINLSSSMTRPKEEIIQKSDSPMVSCRFSLSLQFTAKCWGLTFKRPTWPARSLTLPSLFIWCLWKV